MASSKTCIQVKIKGFGNNFISLKNQPLQTVSNILMLIAISKTVFYCDRVLPTLGKVYLLSAEIPDNEQRTQVFRYLKVSTLHKNIHTESAQRSPSSLMC